MKKGLLIIAMMVATTITFAKKVKFAVDMTGQTINTTGIHIAGDFQDEAGFPGGDWVSNSTPLTQEGTTEIYSIVVDIPAFTKYEFKFINGDQFYEAEFVPLESRVDTLVDDNRWLYIDSLADDTTFVGAILFAANAPAGLTLLRFVVDMQGVAISPDGIHVAGNFQGWDPAKTILYSFFPAYYEVISYVTSGTYEYKFYNGNQISAAEIVPGPCNVNSNREVTVTSDIVLSPVCYSSCSACVVGIAENKTLPTLTVSPNPATEGTILTLNGENNPNRIYITDISGRTVEETTTVASATYIGRNNKPSGIYFIHVVSETDKYNPVKLIFE